MDYRSTGEIQRAHFTQPTLDTPNPVGQWIIDNRRPEDHEDQERAELDPFSKSACNQCRRNNREHHLVDHKGLMRNRRRVVGVRFRTDTIQTNPSKTTKPTTDIRTEGYGIAPKNPLDGNDANH